MQRMTLSCRNTVRGIVRLQLLFAWCVRHVARHAACDATPQPIPVWLGVNQLVVNQNLAHQWQQKGTIIQTLNTWTQPTSVFECSSSHPPDAVNPTLRNPFAGNVGL